jgi:4-alpha-glucanotransferase
MESVHRVSSSTDADRADGGSTLPSRLAELAKSYGVATEYTDWQGRHVDVPADTIVAVLGALGVAARDAEQVESAIEDADQSSWRRPLPPVVVACSGRSSVVAVHAPSGETVGAEVELEDGGRRKLEQQEGQVQSRELGGSRIDEVRIVVPPHLPLGWHTLSARADSVSGSCSLVVVPDAVEQPEALRERRWGLMTQLYSVHSRQSWGLGDLADLAELADWTGRELGGDFVLVNPLHAAEPVAPMEPSPYLPTTRRFVNPVYIRVEDIRELAYLPATERAFVEREAERLRSSLGTSSELDRDAVWTAKRAALEIVFAAPRSPARQASFEAFCRREGQGLTDFATWCALAEQFGLPSSAWPAAARDRRSEEVARWRLQLADRVQFYCWLQWVADSQLETAQRAARSAGMAYGVVHDLAVGVHPEGSDAWSLGEALAHNVTVGAPPDAYNQQGQDWSQPPWRPDTLAELGYAPYRDMLRTVLRHAGGIRIDHIMGLFRLWWVPDGAGPRDGTYVRYDHEALIGILCLEAQRAGAFVVGEDLGTVEPWVRDYLRERGVLGTSVLWFEKDGDGEPLPPESWRKLCLATVNTHDLPPTAGYLAGEHIEVRRRLGLLTRPVEEERAVDEADQASVLAQLRKLGLLQDEAGEQETVEALHRFLTRTPSRLLGMALTDAVGERRTQNQPGTNDEYPNWKIPLADGSGVPVLLEDLRSSPRVLALSRAITPRPVSEPGRAPAPERPEPRRRGSPG